MKQDERLYGLEGWERLETDLTSVVDRVFGEHTRKAGETFDVIADRIEWPIDVTEYKRMELPSAERIAGFALDEVLEWLDQDYADPDDNQTEPTEALKQAAKAFAEVVRREYVSFACEATGRVIPVTREEAKALDWRKS